MDLGDQPWGNHFLTKDCVGKEDFYPLRLIYCRTCSAVQLDYTVKKEIMFSDHTYLSGMTKTLDRHFEKIAEEVDERFFSKKEKKSVLDIGSNDGTQLKHYRKRNYSVLGVESSGTTAAIANENGVPTVHAFFNEETAEKIGQTFDVINASGVFFHLEELHSVTEGIRKSLKEDGVFVVQFIYLQEMMKNGAFDQIYHEHLLYYTLQTLETLLRLHGLELFDAYVSPIHGGSVIAYVKKQGGPYPETERLRRLRAEEQRLQTNSLSALTEFADRTKELKEKTVADLLRLKQSGKTIYAFGAPVKGNTLLNYFGIGADLLDCAVEKNPLRKGLYTPGSHIPVVLENELATLPDVYFVLAWNFKEEILANYQGSSVEFYFPVDPERHLCKC